MRRREIRPKKYLVQSRSFAEMLEATIRRYQNRTIEAAQEFRHLTQPPVEAERVSVGQAGNATQTVLEQTKLL